MVITFLAAALLYTSLEVTYWYVRWYNQVVNKPMPVVKGLLIAVIIAHLFKVAVVTYESYNYTEAVDDRVFYFLMLAGSVIYMLPIWRQHLHRCTTPLSFCLRVAIISAAITGVINAIT